MIPSVIHFMCQCRLGRLRDVKNRFLRNCLSRESFVDSVGFSLFLNGTGYPNFLERFQMCLLFPDIKIYLPQSSRLIILNHDHKTRWTSERERRVPLSYHANVKVSNWEFT
ncbi:hypothetical protein TNCV_1215531 [Trichonephila clavipes]|nr:hypothetical protein TNCV_1215531 [Trichonephila clavipes]